MVTCYLGLGSNLGDRKKNIRLALGFLARLQMTKVETVSQLYDTEPRDCPAGTSRFLNAALKLRTHLSPRALLNEIKKIEARMGRFLPGKNYPRPIDIDILFYGRKKINYPGLIIPHPRLRARDFVLKPLRDISTDIIKSLSKEMLVIRNINKIRRFVNKHRGAGKKIGFVPTMGCLHEGHLSLIRQAKKDCDICVASIFVNPIQFGPKEDYKKYPRDLELDSILAHSAGCDCIFSPQAADMYPEGYATYIDMDRLTNYLCGASRPGHFKGVLTVVGKLFNIISPDLAYFGQKDYQQALVILKMVKDLNMPIKIKIMPTVRQPDGLAMSSRNTYLSPTERADAPVLYAALQMAKEIILNGQKDAKKIINIMRRKIITKKSAKIDYISVADAETLAPLKYLKGKILIALAVWIGKTRLIDNIVVNSI